MFSGKLVAITGGSSGLGESLGRIFTRRGAKVALLARNRDRLEEARSKLVAASAHADAVQVFPMDVANRASVDATYRELVSALGVPDIWINSAGILREGRLSDLSSDIFAETMSINFFGTLHSIKAVLPDMQKRGSGLIVNISSVAGLMGVYGYSAYCSSKHAVVGLSGSLRAELCGTGVSVCVACPGEFESPMVADLNTYRTPENEAMAQTIPVMTAEDVAKEIVGGIEKGRFLIVPGLPARVITTFNRWFPGLARRVADRRVKSCR
ncbi:MAG: SDR family NAD(P)-dependent oxidoreductase [Thermodesulfobacteriota bacterium]